MRRFCLCVATCALSACSADDQRYLLTYEHPKSVQSTATASAAPPLSSQASAEESVERAPVQPALVESKGATQGVSPVESSPPSAVIATSEQASSVLPPVAFVGPAQAAQAPGGQSRPVATKA